MPKYVAGSGPSIAPGDTFQVWVNETPVAGNGGVSASQPVCPTNGGSIGGRGYVFKGQFSGAPGAFEVDCQESDVDTDTAYQTIAGGNVVAVDAINNTFDFEAPQAGAKFLRMLMRTLTNSVTINGYIRQR
jgi:hypothetical protein